VEAAGGRSELSRGATRAPGRDSTQGRLVLPLNQLRASPQPSQPGRALICRTQPTARGMWGRSGCSPVTRCPASRSVVSRGVVEKRYDLKGRRGASAPPVRFNTLAFSPLGAWGRSFINISKISSTTDSPRLHPDLIPRRLCSVSDPTEGGVLSAPRRARLPAEDTPRPAGLTAKRSLI